MRRERNVILIIHADKVQSIPEENEVLLVILDVLQLNVHNLAVDRLGAFDDE